MRRVLVVVCLVVAALGPAALAPAQTVGEPVLLILDASGSMNRAGGGSTLIEVAKDALREIVLQLPPDSEVGLRVYGHRTSNEDPVAGCVDTELIVPVGPIDRDLIIDRIDVIEASGFTPIGLSLQEAARDLDAVGGGTIILVSDGIDTCAPPDPCEIATELAQDGFITRIHTVGFRLSDQAAAAQLGCIADAARGSFTRVDDVTSLVADLTGLVTGSLEGRFVPTIDGGASMALATLLPLEGPFDLQFPTLVAQANGTITTGQPTWYAFDVPDGYNLYAAASIEWQSEATSDETLSVRIFDPDGVEIGVPHEVLGIPVIHPQSLTLRDAGDFIGEAGELPSVEAVTGQHGAPPAWEGDQAWFERSRDRFAAAGINGGMFTAWQELERDPPLEPGRYFVALTWEGERTASSWFEIGVSAYSVDTRPEGEWERAEVMVIDQRSAGTDAAMSLDLVPWAGDALRSSIVPTASLEVWAPAEVGTERVYELDLPAGVLAVRIIMATPDMGGGRVDVDLVDANGVMSPGGVEVEIGEAENGRTWIVAESGPHTLHVRLIDDLPELGVAMSIFTLPLDALVDHDDGDDGGPSPGETFASGPNGRAMMSGLEMVRVVVEPGPE